VSNVLHELGFTDGEVEACLMLKKTAEGISYTTIYMDDWLLCETSKMISKM
jgi:hypothetical protein